MTAALSTVVDAQVLHQGGCDALHKFAAPQQEAEGRLRAFQVGAAGYEDARGAPTWQTVGIADVVDKLIQHRRSKVHDSTQARPAIESQ